MKKGGAGTRGSDMASSTPSSSSLISTSSQFLMAFLVPVSFSILLIGPALRLSSCVSTPTTCSCSSSPLTCQLSTFFTYFLSASQRTTLLWFDESFPGLLSSIGLSLLAIPLTHVAIATTKDIFFQRGFKGRDLLKSSGIEIPESMGLPAASVYMVILFVFIPFRYFPSFVVDDSTTLINETTSMISGRGGFPHHELASFLSALLSFSTAILLGFLDDVFDIRWRYKLPIPIIASIPLLTVYYAAGGLTTVVVPLFPSFLRSLLSRSILDLGPFYYLYMSLLSTFCTNSINILAGINGIEVVQALIISISLIINDFLYLHPTTTYSSSSLLFSRHLFSLYLLLPLSTISATILLGWNRFPSKIFIGDTFCYFSGIVFSTTAILGHFSKTVLLFFFPQLFNFLLSCPQLFGLVSNPRHRVPRIHFDKQGNGKSGGLYPSITFFSHSTTTIESTTSSSSSSTPPPKCSKLTKIILTSLETVHLVQLSRFKNGEIRATSNLTLLNSILILRGVRFIDQDDDGNDNQVFTGPWISEQSLFYHVVAIQIFGSLVAFAIRYWVASLVFPQ